MSAPIATTAPPVAARVYGLLAEFDGPDAVLRAARAAHRAGYRRMDAYTPFPVHGLAAALGHRQTRLPWLVLLGGILGGVGGFAMQYYATNIDYPTNIGGRPFNSWPQYIIITFETTILAAGLFAVLGMLALNGLPQPYHPLFNVPGFELASRTHFFLCIEATDPRFNADETTRFLRDQGGSPITLVPAGRVRAQEQARGAVEIERRPSVS